VSLTDATNAVRLADRANRALHDAGAPMRMAVAMVSGVT